LTALSLAAPFAGQVKWQPSAAFGVLIGHDITRERGAGWLGANFQGPLTRVDVSDGVQR
jgi:hypothetical protein